MKDGWIFHKDPATGKPEFGDGTARLGFYWFPKIVGKEAPTFFLYNYIQAFEAYDEPVRYPKSLDKDNGWYSELGFMSRDNLIPCLACLVILKDEAKLERLFLKILKRWGFLWNTKKIGQKDDAWKIPDWIGLSTIALFFRGTSINYYCLLPGLVLADVTLLISSILRLIGLKINADNCGPDLNLIITHEAIVQSGTETWVSSLARVIYYKCHPGAGPNNQSRMRGFGPFTSLQHYFAGPNNPPLDVHWEAYLNRKDI